MMDQKLNPLALLLSVIVGLTAFSQRAHAFTSEDHILYLPGHTQTVEWIEETETLLVTCDYKNLQGVAPKKGEPCGSEPRLAFSKEDLQKLKYVIFDEEKKEFIYDNSRIIERIYEKFPKLVVVIATDYMMDYSGILAERGQVVNTQHPFDQEAYNFYAERVGRAFALTDQMTNERGVTAGLYMNPFSNHPVWGLNPVKMEDQGESLPLSNHSLIVLPSNPARSTIIHELLHHMIYLSREGVVSDPDRLIQLGKNIGLSSYYFDRFRNREAGLFSSLSRNETDDELTEYIIRYHGIFPETLDVILSEEIEIRYFISKYGRDLGMGEEGISSQRETFWGYIDRYEIHLADLKAIGEGALPSPAWTIMRNIGNSEWEQMLLNAHYDAMDLALHYPKDLLTRPLQPGSTMNYVQRFSREFFPRR